MKTLLFSCAFLCSVAVFAQSTEDKIKDVLENETIAFAQGDLDTWSSYWYHSDNAYFSFVMNNYAEIHQGWEEVYQAFADNFKNREVKTIEKPDVKRANYKFMISKDLAWVQFDQWDYLDMEPEKRHKKETRVLKKTKEGWKIVSVDVVDIYSFPE